MDQKQEQFMRDHFDKVMYLCGLLEQLGNITETFGTEKRKIEEQKLTAKPIHEQPDAFTARVTIPIINTTLETAFKSSIIFFQFSTIEALTSVFADLIVQINSNTFFPPQTYLSQAEIDFITETVTTFDPQKGKTTQKTSYRRLEERLDQLPVLFAKQMGQDFTFTGKDKYWEKFLNLKKVRDSLTHPKTERIYIEDKTIFDGSEVIFWIYECYFVLIQTTLYKKEKVPLKYILNSTLKLVLATYHSTLKQFDINGYEAKHKMMIAM